MIIYSNKEKLESQKEQKDSICKISVSDKDEARNYFLKRNIGRLINPYDVDSLRNSNQWVKVTKECFEFYQTFLETKDRKFLILAERCI